MRIVGLTGGIATGKSTVTNELQQRGIAVIDADKLAHDAARKGTFGYSRVTAAFGDEILLSDGEIDRVKLGDIVFHDAERRRALNVAIQPAIAIALLQHLAYYWIIGTRVVVLDAPLLFETKINRLTKPVVVVACDQAVQEERLMRRNDLTLEQARARIAAQMPLDLKSAQADIVVNNSGSLDELMQQVHVLVGRLNQPSSWRELLLSRECAAALLVLWTALWLLFRPLLF